MLSSQLRSTPLCLSMLLSVTLGKSLLGCGTVIFQRYVRAKKQQIEGAQFVQYFGPLLDALRTLGGSGTPSEVVEQIAADLKISDEAQADLLASGTPRFPNQVAWARFYLAKICSASPASCALWAWSRPATTGSWTSSIARPW